MQASGVLDLFKQSGALLEGHFVLSSGVHTAGYLQCALVLQHPIHAAAFGEALAERVVDLDAASVLSPALGGLIIGHEVARASGVRALFAERRNDVLTLRRGFSLGRGERVLIVEDVVTTGGSTRETMAVAQEAGAEVVGAVSIINRGGGDVAFDVPFVTLAEVSWPTYDPDRCSLCRLGVPLSKPGSRR